MNTQNTSRIKVTSEIRTRIFEPDQVLDAYREFGEQIGHLRAKGVYTETGGTMPGVFHDSTFVIAYERGGAPLTHAKVVMTAAGLGD